MKKNELVTGIVERVDFPNKGLVKVDDTTFCSVKNVLPGQKVVLRVKKIRKGKGEGNLIEVEQKAPNEIEAPCPHFGECGGCTYLNLSYQDQLKLKEEQIKRLLDSALCKPYIWEGIKASPINEEYRNKMEFTFGDVCKGGEFSLGLHQKKSFMNIVDIRECILVHPDMNRIRNAVKNVPGKSAFCPLRWKIF